MATITADLKTGMAVEIRTDHHVWRGDEPFEEGGTDTGPNPYEMLLGALGACVCITVSSYAMRKGLALHSVSARFSYSKVHSDDCRDCETDAIGWLDHVQSEIFVEGSFTEEQRARLAEIAQKCPIRKTLANGISFSDHLVVG